MGALVIQGAVTMQELIASSLAQTDALTKLLIEKGLITKEEFMQKLGRTSKRSLIFPLFSLPVTPGAYVCR